MLALLGTFVVALLVVPLLLIGVGGLLLIAAAVIPGASGEGDVPLSLVEASGHRGLPAAGGGHAPVRGHLLHGLQGSEPRHLPERVPGAGHGQLRPLPGSVSPLGLDLGRPGHLAERRGAGKVR